jgi:biopolymer transport protein ExbD
MRLRRHFHTEESTGIDLAPMLDFVLNLLIFFIITAVFVKELGIDVARHGGAATGRSSEKETGSISIIVKQSGEVMVDGRLIDARATRANIERLHARQEVRHAEIGLTLHCERRAESVGRRQVGVGLIVLSVPEPTEAKLIDRRGRDDGSMGDPRPAIRWKFPVTE